MAKTNFQNGTIVSSAFFNSLYNTGGGHVHDGGADDGHAGKIPIADVDGLSTELGGLDGRLDTLEAQFVTGDISVDVTSTYFTTPVNATWKYKKNITTGEVSIIIPEMFGYHATNSELKFTPNSGTWPAAIVPAAAQFVGGVILAKQANPSEMKSGALLITQTNTDPITAYIPRASDCWLILNEFGTAGAQPKGIYRQTIKYIAD